MSFAATVDQILLTTNAQIAQNIITVIHDIQVVSGFPFLGYHTSETLFLKILVTEPSLLNPTATLLRNGKVMGTRFLIFETHIHYFLKFSQDCQICPSSLISIRNCCKRVSGRNSFCDFEFDCQVHDICSNITNDTYLPDHEPVNPTNVNSPELLGVLKRRQQIQRSQMMLNIDQQTQATDEVLRDSTKDDDEIQNVDKKDLAQDNTQLDILAFEGIQTDLDGGEQDDNSMDDETLVPTMQTQRALLDFLEGPSQKNYRLHFGNSKDIPNQHFVWAGKEHDFTKSQAIQTQQISHQQSTEKKIECISICSDSKEQPTTYCSIKLFRYSLSKQLINSMNSSRDKTNQIVPQKQSCVISQELIQVHNQTQLMKFIGGFDSTFMKAMILEISQLNDSIVVVFFDSFEMQQIPLDNITTEIHVFIYLFKEIFGKTQLQQIRNYCQTKYKCRSENLSVVCGKEEIIYQDILPKLIKFEDPDIIFSFCGQRNGISRVIINAIKYQIDFIQLISRIRTNRSQIVIQANNQFDKLYDELISNGVQFLNVPGRMYFDVQQIFRSSIKLNNYDISDIMIKLKIQDKETKIRLNYQFVDAIINKTGAYRNQQTFQDDQFYSLQFQQQQGFSGNIIQLPLSSSVFDCIDFTISQVLLLKKNNFITNTIEQSKLFKTPFFETYTRGSQFKVETFLFQKAKQYRFLLGPSPTHQEVANMRAMESVPLVAEPISKFYDYPLLVFDFASLYPTIIAAYNLCYSTLFKSFDTNQELGPFNIIFRQGNFNDIQPKEIFCSPASVFYTKKNTRRGIFAEIMKSCLESRTQITKLENQLEADIQVLKTQLSNNQLEQYQQVLAKLHSRQMALKGLMNTTYGYTSASFTGRMPCQPVADTIMEMSRQSLNFCIQFVEKEYGCDVVYADTDSLFVDSQKYFEKNSFKLKKLSIKEQLDKALTLGNEILTAINSMIPPPMRLKLEKIYAPCILITKKRYVGNAHLPDAIKQATSRVPNFIDAKGIESIRREVPQLVRTIISDTIHVLFTTRDLSLVKNRILSYLTSIIFGRISLLDYRFQRKVGYSERSMSYSIQSKQATCFWLQREHGERASYVVAKENESLTTKRRISDIIQDPIQIIQVNKYQQNYCRIYVEYYIERQIIPPLQRLFGICGLDVENIYLSFKNWLLHSKDLIYNLQLDNCGFLNQFMVSFIFPKQYQPLFIDLQPIYEVLSKIVRHKNLTSYYIHNYQLSIPEIIFQFQQSKQKTTQLVNKMPKLCLFCKSEQLLIKFSKIYLCIFCKKRLSQKNIKLHNVLVHLDALIKYEFSILHMLKLKCALCNRYDESQICVNFQCEVLYSIAQQQNQCFTLLQVFEVSKRIIEMCLCK